MRQQQKIWYLPDGRIPTARELYKMLAQDGITGDEADDIVSSQGGVRARARTAEAVKVGGGGLRGAAILTAELVCAATEPKNQRRLFECRGFGSGMRNLRDSAAWTVSLEHALIKCIANANLQMHRIVICFHEVAGSPEMHEPAHESVLVLAARTVETRRLCEYVRFDEVLRVHSLIRLTDALLRARNGQGVENMPMPGVPLSSPFELMDLPGDALMRANHHWCAFLADDE